MPQFKTLYMGRRVENHGMIRDLAARLGVTKDDFNPHVALTYSAQLVDWDLPVFMPREDIHVVKATRFHLHHFGHMLALRFLDPILGARWSELRNAGAIQDFPLFNAHIYLGCDPDQSVDVSQLVELPESVILGVEYRQEIRGA